MPSISTKRLFAAGTMFQNKTIHFEHGKITGIENATDSPTFENISAPFFDTHINGGEKLYMTQEVSMEAIDDIFTASLKTGTFYVLPCVITSSLENILKGLEAIKNYMNLNPKSGVVGLHLEGPFLNPVKRGAHLAKYVRKPSNTELAKILEAGKGLIKIMTIAPEQFTEDQIQMIQNAGICISAGHSNATNLEANRSFDLGINLVTHLFNAMSGLHHRKPGLVGSTLARKEVWAPIILDGKHCDFDAAKVAFNAKPDKLFIISDALFLGQRKLKFQWEEFDATLINGEYINADGNLAGSAVSMGECIKNAVEQVNIPLETAIDMATERPAKALGVEKEIGKINVGYPSIFTSFNNELNQFEVLNMA